MASGAAPWAASSCSFDDGFRGGVLPWSGSGASVIRRAPATDTGTRLVVDARDAKGGVTEFLVDTGTSCAFVSDTSAASRTATGSERRVRLTANEGACSYVGRDSMLPTIDLGGLDTAQLPVFVVERAHDLRCPANVLGMSWMSGLALTHDARGDTWRLIPSGSAAHAGAGEMNIEAPGLPVVALLDARGRQVFGLIDTGTPRSLIEVGQPAGTYRLTDASGRTLLAIEAHDDAPWRGLRPGGRPVVVWIGLDALSTRSWTLDFATRRWSFAP